MRCKFFIFFAVVSLGFASGKLIPHIVLHSDETLKISICDMFPQRVGETSEIKSDKLSVEISENHFIIRHSALDTQHSVWSYFTAFGETVPVLIVPKSERTFNIPSSKNTRQISIAGSFNGWNKDANPLEKSENTFQGTVELTPGTYQYKIVIDGKWICDPTNPDSVSNGMGGYNSVLKIGEMSPFSCGYFQDKIRDDTLVFRWESDVELLPATPLILIDNIRISEFVQNQKTGELTVNIPLWAKKSEHILRIFASDKQGRVAAENFVIIKNGIPKNQIENHNLSIINQDLIGYMVMVDRFFDGDLENSMPIIDAELGEKANYQGGDLMGILQKLRDGYFDELGINLLWISPLNENPDEAFAEFPEPHRKYSAYHGYWPTEPRTIESRFGNAEIMKEVVDEAHERGMKVIIDFVSNHTHENHPYFQAHPDWFTDLDLPGGRKNIRLWDEQRLTTWFDTFLPSFDFSRQEVIDLVSDDAVWWLEEFDLDGFRHDATKHIPTQFWRELTQKIQSKTSRDIFQIGETYGSRELIGSYVGRGKLDAQFDFNLFHSIQPIFAGLSSDISEISMALYESSLAYGFHSEMGTLIDNHDKPRFLSLADGSILPDEDAREVGWTREISPNGNIGYKKQKLFLTFLLTMPGVPMLFYGDEIGMSGAGDPDNRRMMRFGEDLSENERKMLETTKELIHLRNEHPVLKYGDFRIIEQTETKLIYERSDFYETFRISLDFEKNQLSITNN